MKKLKKNGIFLAVRCLLSMAVFAVAVLAVGKLCAAYTIFNSYTWKSDQLSPGNFPSCNGDNWLEQYETFLRDKGTSCMVDELVPVEVVEHDGYCVFIDREKKQAAAFVFHYTNNAQYIDEKSGIEIGSAPKTVEITEKEKGFPVVKVYVDYMFNDRTVNDDPKGQENPMTLKIPRYVTDVEAAGNALIEKLEVAKENPVLKVVNDVFLYKKVKYRGEDTWALYRCVVKDKGEKAVSIPSGTKVIMPYALWKVNFGVNTKKIVLPDSVKRIGEYAFDSLNVPVYIPKGTNSMGSCAFWNTEIYFPHGTKMKVLDLGVTNRSFQVPEGITRVERLYTDDKSTKKVTLSSTVKTIASRAFAGDNIVSISLGKNVQRIGNEAFAGCLKLEKITLSKRLQSIGDGAFNRCIKLKKITLPDQLRSIGRRSFYCCVKLKKITLPKRLQSIGKRAFLGTNILSLKVPASVKKLEAGSFVRFDKKNRICADVKKYHLKTKPRMITLKVKKKSYVYRYAKKKGWKYKLG